MQGGPAVPSRTAGLQVSAPRSDRTPVTLLRRLLLPLLLLALAAPAAAHGEAFAPPNGKVLNGLTAGYDFDDFTRRAGKAPAVWQHFVAWNGSLGYTVDNTRKVGARLMYHLGTASGQNLPERISPGEIARGKGDAYLIRLDAHDRRLRAAGVHPPDGRDEQLRQRVLLALLHRRPA